MGFFFHNFYIKALWKLLLCTLLERFTCLLSFFNPPLLRNTLIKILKVNLWTRLHANIGDIRSMAKSAVKLKHCFLIFNVFTSKVYTYPKKTRSLLKKKLEFFYQDMKEKKKVTIKSCECKQIRDLDKMKHINWIKNTTLTYFNRLPTVKKHLQTKKSLQNLRNYLSSLKKFQN